jgi:hypothetical protein
MMDFSMAATTAASTANNVTQNLNSTILQLQSSVNGVETAVKDISQSANGDGLDLGKLSMSVSELEGRQPCHLFSLIRLEEHNPSSSRHVSSCSRQLKDLKLGN